MAILGNELQPGMEMEGSYLKTFANGVKWGGIIMVVSPFLLVLWTGISWKAGDYWELTSFFVGLVAVIGGLGFYLWGKNASQVG